MGIFFKNQIRFLPDLPAQRYHIVGRRGNPIAPIVGWVARRERSLQQSSGITSRDVAKLTVFLQL